MEPSRFSLESAVKGGMAGAEAGGLYPKDPQEMRNHPAYGSSDSSAAAKYLPGGVTIGRKEAANEEGKTGGESVEAAKGPQENGQPADSNNEYQKFIKDSNPIEAPSKKDPADFSNRPDGNPVAAAAAAGGDIVSTGVVLPRPPQQE